MRTQRWLWLVLSLLVVGCGIWFGRSFFFQWIEPHPRDVDPGEKSSDLPADLKLMWETRRLGGTLDPTHGPNPRCSTDRAINAASRVFNTVKLVGNTRDQVVTQLGDPKSSSDSIYNFPFYGAPPGTLVYRFDSGAYGWQFNVVFGNDGRVREVHRLGIE
jgi:hypothetical protein